MLQFFRSIWNSGRPQMNKFDFAPAFFEALCGGVLTSGYTTSLSVRGDLRLTSRHFAGGPRCDQFVNDERLNKDRVLVYEARAESGTIDQRTKKIQVGIGRNHDV
jgi:hypothetical protein